MDGACRLAYILNMDIGTKLNTWLTGRLVGTDAAGNRYYTARKPAASGRTRRWVDYVGYPDASKVPPEWHMWLHYTVDAPLPETGRKPWQKPHLANATGTPEAYYPPGHRLAGGQRAKASSDYQAWTPTD